MIAAQPAWETACNVSNCYRAQKGIYNLITEQSALEALCNTSIFWRVGSRGCKHSEGEEVKMIEPKEACSRIAEVVQEAVAKMGAVVEEKACALKKARLALETCDTEFDDKRRELAKLEFDRQQKKQQIEELESIVRLKQVEADMFQMRADEARHEAENLQRVVAVKSEKIEEEYTSRYLKSRLNEVETEQHHLFEKIRLQEHSQLQPEPSKMLMMCKIQDLLKQVYPKNDTVGHIKNTGPPS